MARCTVPSPPLLVVWGKNDPFFLPPSAEAFQRDNRKAEVRLYDTGHFALATHPAEIAGAIRDFLNRNLQTETQAASANANRQDIIAKGKGDEHTEREIAVRMENESTGPNGLSRKGSARTPFSARPENAMRYALIRQVPVLARGRWRIAEPR